MDLGPDPKSKLLLLPHNLVAQKISRILRNKAAIKKKKKKDLGSEVTAFVDTREHAGSSKRSQAVEFLEKHEGIM